MKLLSSLKQKKRYLVVEIISTKKFTVAEVAKAVEGGLLAFLGELGVAKAASMFLKERFDYSKQRFILKVNHKHVDEAKAALSLVKKIKNYDVVLKSVLTTGTIKKAQVKMI